MKSHIKIWTIPNMVTLLNMICGTLSILASLQGELTIAFALILLGALFDFLDGFLARLLKQPSAIGAQLDSLADAISFSLAPGIFVFCYLCFLQTNPFILDSASPFELRHAVQLVIQSWWNLPLGKMHLFPLLALLIPAFSILRLAKFNIDDRQSDSFIGLPTPANALFFVSLTLTCIDHPSVSLFHSKIFWTILIFLFSFLLISEFRLFALKFKTWKWKDNRIRYTFLGSSLIIILIPNHASIAIIVFLYLIFSLCANYTSKKQKNEV